MEVLLLALLAVAQDAQVKPAEPVRDADKIECRKIEVIGSRINVRKVCLPASEWAQRTRDDIEATRDIQRPIGCRRNSC